MSEALAVKEGLFEAGADGSARLICGHCAACGRHHFPRAAVCPYCSADDCGERRLGPCASIWLHTTVTNRPRGYRGAVPFGFGVVELPEGLRVISLLAETDAARRRFGQPGRLVVHPLHRDDDGRQVVTYAFAGDET